MDSSNSALHDFNKIATAVNGVYPRSAFGDFKIRSDALQLYINSGKCIRSLMRGLFKLRPHWRNVYAVEVQSSPRRKVLMFFKLCGASRLYGEEGKYQRVTPKRYVRDLKQGGMYEKVQFEKEAALETAKKRGAIAISRLPKIDHCIIHHDKPIYNKTHRICTACYQKMRKLGILHLQIDDTIMHLLKNRLKKGFKITTCVNHKERIALNNQLCLECNVRAGLLEYKPGEIIKKRVAEKIIIIQGSSEWQKVSLSSLVKGDICRFFECDGEEYKLDSGTNVFYIEREVGRANIHVIPLTEQELQNVRKEKEKEESNNNLNQNSEAKAF